VAERLKTLHGGVVATGMDDRDIIELGGETLLHRAIERLTPQVDTVVINANDDPARFAEVSHLPVIPDLDGSRSGPLAGVLAGLDYAATQDATHIVSIAVDTPFFPTDLVARLRAAAEGQGVPLACAKTGDRTHPVFGLWPVALADDLRAAMADGMRKVDRWTGKHGCAETVFEATPFDPFFNVNTPEDLTEARGLLA